MAQNPILSLFAPIERLINEHGSATILREQLALFKDQLCILKEKFSDVVSENEALKSKCAALTKENAELKDQLQMIKEQQNPNGDPCPYCRQPGGQLVDLKPHPIFGEVGLKVGYYECAKCGKTYDKQQKP